jgi:hypothetical protein
VKPGYLFARPLKAFEKLAWRKGAMTLSTMAFRRSALSIMTFRIKAFSIKLFRIMTFIIKALCL